MWIASISESTKLILKKEEFKIKSAKKFYPPHINITARERLLTRAYL